MVDYASLILTATEFAKTETGRITATVGVIWLAAILISILQRRARTKCADESEVARQRSNFVVAKNLILVLAVGIVCAIWASKIAGAALSVAAIAGAILLVTKDFLVNLLGTAVLAIARPYRVGDFIEINGISGCVVDTNMLNTTIADTPHGNLLTGSTVTFPHMMLLSMPVRNITATGSFVLRLLTVSVAPREVSTLEPILLQAAKEVCDPWIEEASAHFRMIESRELLDLPSGTPKVIIDLANHQHAALTLRYACRPQERITVEQAILRAFLKLRETHQPGHVTLSACGTS